MPIPAQFGLLLASAVVSAGLILLLRPVLARYAMARPNARSLHAKPTPQGGGIAVVAATIIVVAGAAVLMPELLGQRLQLAIVFGAAVGLAAVGVTDDVRPMEALPRLAFQAIAVAVVIAALPADLRVVPLFPWWLERLLILIGGVWFVNLVNFMDGIDWMTVAEVVPVTAALALFGAAGAVPPMAGFVALALCGATLGFAPFNKPVARLFLGDVGSLPIGLLLGWLLIQLAGQGHLAAAVLLPLYYLADTAITLAIRLANGEPITQAHRSHFYQRAIIRGFSVYAVVTRVFLVNLILAALAAVSLSGSMIVNAAAIAVGIVAVVALLRVFAGSRR